MDHDKYRFYHCHETTFRYSCKRLQNDDTTTSIRDLQPNSRFLFVSKWIPEMLDAFFLHRFYSQKHLTIDDTR